MKQTCLRAMRDMVEEADWHLLDEREKRSTVPGSPIKEMRRAVTVADDRQKAAP